MNKNDIKKIIISIAFIVFLVMFFLLWKNINDNKRIKSISIVKNIVKEKYNSVYYKENSKYIYTLNKENGFIYDVFDLHGNKLYSINSNKELNIIKVMKKYYIIYDQEYRLFNDKNNEIVSGSVIEGINEYLIRIDDRIINYNNEELFKDIHTVTTFSNNKYINLNNYYLINKKGDVIEENVFVNKEIKNNSITDYLIIKKGEKYYTFFISLDKIIGDGFDSYYIDNNVLIKKDNTIYKIYKTGLRKKINTISNKIVNNYYINDKYLLENKLFVTSKKTNYFGVIDLKSNKFTKITKSKINSIKKIDNNNYCISIKNGNIIFNVESNKIVIKKDYDLDNSLVFKNKYITTKSDNKYILYDNKDNIVATSDKQILIKSKIIAGKVNDEIVLYNIKDKSKLLLNKVIVNKNNYYYDNNKVYDLNFDLIAKSDLLIFNNNSIVYQKDKKIIIDNRKENKKYYYNLIDGEEVVNNNIKDIIIIENSNYIKVLDKKGDLLKKIRNKKITNYYISKNGFIILITSYDNGKDIYYGSYLAE